MEMMEWMEKGEENEGDSFGSAIGKTMLMRVGMEKRRDGLGMFQFLQMNELRVKEGMGVGDDGDVRGGERSGDCDEGGGGVKFIVKEGEGSVSWRRGGNMRIW